jgi:oxygen-independent coproporphyrinogen-3 oxidase
VERALKSVIGKGIRNSVLGGVYVHWPFCARKCPYCDFFTFGREHPQFESSKSYLGALVEEIETARERFGINEPAAIDTIYFGGGTPSLMAPEEIEFVLGAVRTSFKVAHGAEITMEVNPTAAEVERLRAARGLGVNRLSVGCQSFNEKFLQILGRDHDAPMARRALERIREIGFENCSLDLMFGLPGQTLEEFREDLETAIAIGPEHVSAYGLTLHEGTPFKRWHREGRWRLPESEIEAAMFELLIERLGEAGYVHYEISNWARLGLESRHNSKYWRRCDVFAFGASAHGVIGGARYSNPRDLGRYMGSGELASRSLAVAESAPESQRARAGEAMMLALRRIGGVTWDELEEWIGEDPRVIYKCEIEKLFGEGLIAADDERVSLTRRGILLADSVMEEFF